MIAEISFHVQEGPFWNWRVALDLFLGGAGVGSLLFAIILDERYKGQYRRICQTAAWLSVVLITTGLLLVMSKMGRPLHLFLADTNFHPSAPLWWGGIFQPLLVIGAFIYALKWRGDKPSDPNRLWLGRLLAPLAIVVGAYHGLLLSLMPARPLWNTGPTTVSALLGFVSTGIAVVLLVHLIRMKSAGRLSNMAHVASFLDDIRHIRNILVVVLLMQLGTFFVWWLSLKFGTLQDQQALALANETSGPMFWYLGVGIGLILPLLLGGFVVLRGEATHRPLQITMIGMTSILILVGGFFFRLTQLLAGQGELPVTLNF